jgi:hypothetical protein
LVPKLKENDPNPGVTIAVLTANFTPGQLHSLASTHWNQVNTDMKNRFARMAAAAAWGLSQWSAMEDYVNFIPKETQDGSFYRAVLAIHRCGIISL